MEFIYAVCSLFTFKNLNWKNSEGEGRLEIVALSTIIHCPFIITARSGTTIIQRRSRVPHLESDRTTRKSFVHYTHGQIIETVKIGKSQGSRKSNDTLAGKSEITNTRFPN